MVGLDIEASLAVLLNPPNPAGPAGDGREQLFVDAVYRAEVAAVDDVPGVDQLGGRRLRVELQDDEVEVLVAGRLLGGPFNFFCVPTTTP